MHMRKIALAAAAGVAGLMIATAPASALSTYQIQTDGGANFDGSPSGSTSRSGFSMMTKTSTEDAATGLPLGANGSSNFGASQTTQDNLSGDMGWQGTGYYLRPKSN